MIRLAKQKISANLDHHWSKKCLFLCVQTNWVCPSGTQRFCKNDSVSSHWLWLESSHSVKNVTRVEWPRIMTWVGSSHWLESRYHCQSMHTSGLQSSLTTWKLNQSTKHSPQRWVDCEIFQSESNPDPQNLNPIQYWSAKFLKITDPIQSWSANLKPCILFCLMRQNRHSFLAFPKFNMAVFILPSEAKALLELFCH